MKPTYKVVANVTIESATENELDIERIYEKMRMVVKDMPDPSKNAKLSSFRLLAEFDVEGKQIVHGSDEDCGDCPQTDL